MLGTKPSQLDMLMSVATGDRYYSLPELKALILARFDRIVSECGLSARWREVPHHRQFKRKRSAHLWEYRVSPLVPDGMLL